MKKKIDLKIAFNARRERIMHRASMRRDHVPPSAYREKIKRQLPEEVGIHDQHVYLFLVSLRHGYPDGTIMLFKTPNDRLIRFGIIEYPHVKGHHPALIAIQEAWDAANECKQKKTFPRITITSDITDEGTTVRGAIHLFHDPAWLQWAFLGYDKRLVEDFVWTLDHPKTPYRSTGEALPLTFNDMSDAMAAILGVPRDFLWGTSVTQFIPTKGK